MILGLIIMPVVYREYITRWHLQNHRDMLFLFGDNELRKGLKGQAYEMRGEPNAIGIRTKKLPSMENGSFWSDRHFDYHAAMIDDDFRIPKIHVENGGFLVIPMSGLGSGNAKLDVCAPRLYNYIKSHLCILAKLGNKFENHDDDLNNVVEFYSNPESRNQSILRNLETTS